MFRPRGILTQFKEGLGQNPRQEQGDNEKNAEYPADQENQPSARQAEQRGYEFHVRKV